MMHANILLLIHIVGANTNSILDWLARCWTAISVTTCSTKSCRWSANESTVLVTRRGVAEHALRFGGGTIGNVAGALSKGTLGGTETTWDAANLEGGFIRHATIRRRGVVRSGVIQLEFCSSHRLEMGEHGKSIKASNCCWSKKGGKGVEQGRFHGKHKMESNGAVK